MTSRKFMTFLLHWIVSSKSWSINNLQKCFLIFSESGPLTFLKIANSSSRYKARFFLSYFSDNLWNKNLATSTRTYVKQPPVQTIASSSVGMSMFSSANFKAFQTEVLWLKDKCLLYRIGQICKGDFHQY